jgi:gamma-tubulin complex component 2
MQTCTFFATYTGWLSRELERSDPDLSGSEKPGQMSKQQWERYQAERAQKHGDLTTSNASPTTPSEEALVMISKFEVNFSRHLQILLDALNHSAATETVVLLGLCARLSTANQGTTYSGLRADEDVASHG